MMVVVPGRSLRVRGSLECSGGWKIWVGGCVWQANQARVFGSKPGYRSEARRRDSSLLGGIRAGAKGFLLKDVSLDQLTHAIRTLASGGTMIQPAVTDRVLKGLGELRHEFESLDPPDPLTERETEILRLMAGGYSNREIARAFELAEGTVKNHISNILSKLGVRDRTRAVLKSVELSIIA